jgi:hypothetical protein
MRALNIIRGISALMFVVLYFILYNYTQGLQTMAIGFCLAMVLINIVLVINYEINKVMKNVLRFIGVIAIIVSLSNVIIGIKGYNENIVLIGASVFITVVGFVLLIAADNAD